jgi:hypothetical protein
MSFCLAKLLFLVLLSFKVFFRTIKYVPLKLWYQQQPGPILFVHLSNNSLPIAAKLRVFGLLNGQDRTRGHADHLFGN